MILLRWSSPGSSCRADEPPLVNGLEGGNALASAPPVSLASSVGDVWEWKDSGRNMHILLTSLLLAPSLLAYVVPPFAGARAGPVRRVHCRASLPCASATSLAGFDEFVRTNPRSDRFDVDRFHHVEFYCADAQCTAGRFAHALGMDVLAASGPQSGNHIFSSVVIGSGDVRFCFTAPLQPPLDSGEVGASPPTTGAVESRLADAVGFDADAARRFIAKHGGVAVRSVGLLVADADAAYTSCLEGGGEGVLAPRALPGGAGGRLAEVRLYGDAVLRFVELDHAAYDGALFPGYVDAVPHVARSDGGSASAADGTYGIRRIDHVVGNVWEMMPTIERLRGMTGFHDFAEFTSEDVGTIDSGLNSMVLANNKQNVLLPVNEPTYGTRRRSQIETYLVSHGGEGVQHIALFTDDIFHTIRQMRAAGRRGGFQLMDRPSDEYYEELPGRIGDGLSADDLATARELGLLVDRDPEGVLIQVFTRPVGDRPTLFLEIIQRVGCMVDDATRPGGGQVQRGGCGGFGKGNFKELFKSVEAYERSLEGGSDAPQK